MLVRFAVTIGDMKKIISTNEAPGAIGPYSQAVRSGNFLFCSGQIPLDPKSGQIVPGDIAAQTRRVLDNIAAVLRAEGLTFDNVVKTTIFLTDLGDFQTVNEVYGSYFKQSPPARSTVQVSALPKGAKVEIEAIAAAGEAEHMLAEVGQHEVVAHRGDLQQLGLPELALDVVLGRERVAAEGVHRRVARLGRGLGGEQLGHVRLRPARLAFCRPGAGRPMARQACWSHNV